MNSRKTTSTLIIATAVFVVIVVFLGTVTYKSRVIINDKIFIVDVVDTKPLLEKGLSGRAMLPKDEGMFFVFKEPNKYGFWMKDMKFPIDIIWIDQNFKIIYLEKFVATSTYPKIFYPKSPAMYVLEISAGQSDILNIKIGDAVKFVRK